MGGGVVGVEMSQAFQTLGSQVTLVEGERRLLPREEEYACAQVTDALEGYGVDIRCGQKASRVEERDGTVMVTTEDGGTAEGDTLLVALGRTPQTAGARPRGGRAAGRPAGGGRRADAGPRPPVAVRDRRHQRPRAVHPHGQVPGADRGRPHHGARHVALARRRRPAQPARDLHRAAGRGGRPHERHAPRRRAWSSTSSRPRRRATPAAPSTAAARSARRGC